MSKYETVIGLEIHCQLATESKMFCSCSTKFGAEPNTNVCPICTGQPGVLPKINKKAVELALKTAIALNCKIEPSSVFARKNYFYPDLPKNFQISQYELPLATNGYLEIEVERERKKIGITRVHLEEDAGKLVHVGAERIMGSDNSLVDYNRGGTPLMEIVSEPDLRSPLEAKIYMETLAHLLQFIGVSDAKMEEGSLRCDANISIRQAGEKKLGVKTELKNVNSFRFVQKGLEAEEKRHREMAEAGEKVVQETRYFDTNTEDTKSMRSKEFAHDYRYFPEPDLVEAVPDEQWISGIRASLFELPEKKKERYINSYGLPKQTAEILVAERETSEYFEKCVAIENNPKEIANWILQSGSQRIPPEELVSLIKLVEAGSLSRNSAKEVMQKVLQTGKKVKEIISAEGLTQISGEDEILKIVNAVIKNNPKQVEQFKSGKEAVIMFLVGQVMKESKGRARPDIVQTLLRKNLTS